MLLTISPVTIFSFLAPLEWALTAGATDIQTDIQCSDLSDVKIVNYERAGPILEAVCNHWPSDRFGPFPVGSVDEAEQIVNTVFGPDGVLRQLASLAKHRNASSDFCWKHSDKRQTQTPKGYDCPSVFNPPLVWSHEIPTTSSPKQISGSLCCEKDCAHVCGNRPDRTPKNDSSDTCECLEVFPSPDDPPMVLPIPRIIPARPTGCSFVYANTCYGECSAGFTPTAVIHELLPVCSTVCQFTQHKQDCGFGCTNSESDCATHALAQVVAVFKAIGDVASFLTGNVQIAITTDALVSVVEFAVTSLSSIVKLAVTAWTAYYKKQQKVGIVAAIFAMLDDKSIQELIADGKSLLSKYGRFVSLIMELMGDLSGFHIEPAADLARTLLGSGVQGVLAVYDMLQVFLYPSCIVMPTVV